ncbi:MAG: nuclease-related domain-containing protein [Mariprofundaceae bacterium]
MDLFANFYTAMPLALSLAAVLLLLLSFWLAWPWTANAFRQVKIRRTLTRLESKGAEILQNLILPDRKGGSVWIDYLIITSKGITAVQLMACSGRIFGSPHDATWVQEHGHSRYRFANPLRQSDQAASVIRNILGKFDVQEALVYSGCKLHESMPDNVLEAADMEAFLLQEEGKKLSASRRSWIVNTLTQLAIQDDKLVQQHERDALERQGETRHLNWAKRMMLASCGCMVLAVGLVGYHLINR